MNGIIPYIKLQQGGSGSSEPIFRYSTMPTAGATYAGKIVQFIGTTDANYTNGYFYKCGESGGTYSWSRVDVQPSGGGGSNLDLSIVNGKLCVSFEEE